MLRVILKTDFSDISQYDIPVGFITGNELKNG